MIEVVKLAFTLGAAFTIRKRMSTRFWLDRWLCQAPLWEEFYPLYALAMESSITIAAALPTPNIVAFRRSLQGPESESWAQLYQRLAGVSLSLKEDEVS